MIPNPGDHTAMKPIGYRDSFVVMQDAAYTLVNESGDVMGLPRTGLFKVGRVVWLPPFGKIKTLAAAHIVAWAEGVGTVSISRNVLASAR
jgi:hypothetical protein